MRIYRFGWGNVKERTEYFGMWCGWAKSINSFGWGNVRERTECVGIWLGWGSVRERTECVGMWRGLAMGKYRFGWET